MILFEILKIIAYIFLILLCVIIALVLLILIIPVFYRINISSDEGFVLKGKVKVLFGLLNAEISSDSGEKVIYKFCNIPLKSIQKEDDKINVNDDFKSEEELFNMSVKLNSSDSFTQSIDEISEKNKNIFDKIKDKIYVFFASVKEKILSFINTVINIKNKVNRIIDFISDENVISAFTDHKSRVFKILTHIGPVKSNFCIEFGLDDPATVGYILAVISPFYGLYGKWLSIIPYFDENVFKAYGNVKGRIFPFVLIWHFIRVYFDKHVKTIRIKYKTSV